MIVPAVGLGAFVVFGIGYVMTHVIAGQIEQKIEARQRKRSGLIPPVDQTTLDVDMLSIVGGVMAVVLVLALLVAVPRESKELIWYVLTGIGILFGLLTFILSGSDATPTKTTTSSSDPVYRQNQRPQQRKDHNTQNQRSSEERLYQDLLMKTRNNRDLADRLIEYERKHKPTASREELIRSAIERWERDNR